MPREYDAWDIPDDTRAQLDNTMRGGNYAGLAEGRDAAEVQAIQDQIGREALTAQLAGTTDKRSREWKNARDSLSRWRSGRRAVSARGAGRLRGAAESAWRDRMRRGGSLHVSLHATVRTSRTDWTGNMSADLTGSDLEDYLDALERGDFEQAAQIVADAYGLDPAYILSIESVHGFEAHLPDDEEDEE